MQEVINTKDPREVIFVVAGGTCGLVLILLIAQFVVGLVTYDSERTLAGPVTLSTSWIEITPDKPIRIAKRAQELVLDVDPAEGLVKDNLHGERMQLASGMLVKPEVQLVDQSGNVFTALVENSPAPSKYANGLLGYFSELPADRTYTKVRIRSDKPVRLSRVVWYCWNGK